MKKVLLFLMLVSALVFAQDIPNASFETWTNGNPDLWITDNIPAIPPFFPGAVVVTQSADNHSGSSSAKLEIISLDGDPFNPYLYSIFPATQKYGSLTGFYKFAPQSNAHVLVFDVWIFHGSTITGQVGFGELEIYAPASSFTQFSVPIDYSFSTTETPDSAWIWISIEDTAENPTAGAVALIDDLSWGPIAGVEKVNANVPSAFKLQQNYPNPFNPSTMIEYSIPKESFIELKVYDIIGNELSTLVSEYQPAGNFRTEFNAVNLSSGIYIAKLTAGSFRKSIKMTLMK
jgi:hypothetical protein